MARMEYVRNNALLLASALLSAIAVGTASCNPSSTASASADRPTRTFRLEAEDTHFVMEGERDPTLHVDKGDRVRLTFENTQHGVHHAINVPPFTDGTHEVEWGEETTVSFVASKAGTFKYTCPHHAPFMQGELVVRSSDSNSSD